MGRRTREDGRQVDAHIRPTRRGTGETPGAVPGNNTRLAPVVVAFTGATGQVTGRHTRVVRRPTPVRRVAPPGQTGARGRTIV